MRGTMGRYRSEHYPRKTTLLTAVLSRENGVCAGTVGRPAAVTHVTPSPVSSQVVGLCITVLDSMFLPRLRYTS